MTNHHIYKSAGNRTYNIRTEYHVQLVWIGYSRCIIELFQL